MVFTKAVLGLTLTTLIFATVVMGYGTHIGKVTKENELFGLASLIAVEQGNPATQKIILEQAAKIARYEVDSTSGQDDSVAFAEHDQ